jgi:hypothetical protein
LGRIRREAEVKKELLGVMIAVGLLGWAARIYHPAPDAAEAASQTTPPAAKALLEATVRIDLYAPHGENSREKLSATGLGTLVTAGGERVIVTHDHWGPVLDGVTKARFSSADNQGLLELDGPTFVALIRDRGGGTMILEAPEILVVRRPWLPRLQPLAAGDGASVQPGDTVTVAYRPPADGHRSASTFEAVVISLQIKDGQPAWRLQSTHGEQVIPGDSGGGIAKDGRLVGNLWASVIDTVFSSTTPAGEDVQTDRSVGAVLEADDLLDGGLAEDPATHQPDRSSPDDGGAPLGDQARGPVP